jgi:hypothetical protein
MKIPANAEIVDSELSDYLLRPRGVDDKSGFLAQAGFDLRNRPLLLDALRELALANEAVADRTDVYGTFYRIKGSLTGPNGRRLEVVTIWLCSRADNRYRFITLKPMR